MRLPAAARLMSFCCILQQKYLKDEDVPLLIRISDEKWQRLGSRIFVRQGGERRQAVARQGRQQRGMAGMMPQGMSCFSLTLVLGIKKSLRAYCSEGFSSEKSATEDRQPDGRSGRAALASWLCAPRFHVVCSFLCVMRFSHAHPTPRSGNVKQDSSLPERSPF